MNLEWRVFEFGADEEEEFVFYYRTTESESVDGTLYVAARCGKLLAVNLVSAQRLVFIICGMPNR